MQHVSAHSVLRHENLKVRRAIKPSKKSKDAVDQLKSGNEPVCLLLVSEDSRSGGEGVMRRADLVFLTG